MQIAASKNLAFTPAKVVRTSLTDKAGTQQGRLPFSARSYSSKWSLQTLCQGPPQPSIDQPQIFALQWRCAITRDEHVHDLNANWELCESKGEYRSSAPHPFDITFNSPLVVRIEH